ncbi:MAG: hypothetical protein BIFFINMI_04383 [Phycisphaerae bacterium]|nr:hypothetical protein [Phycisphaerae bacterium]
MKVLATTALMCALAATLIGCGPKVAYDQPVVVELKETTGLRPIRMTVTVDGQYVFGPWGTLNPGQTEAIVVHDGKAIHQVPGQHEIVYTFDRRGSLRGIGEGMVTVRSGEMNLYSQDSEVVLDGTWMTNAFYYQVGWPKDDD